MNVIHIYHNVTYYVISCKSSFDWVYTEQWYVIITSDVTCVMFSDEHYNLPTLYMFITI